jgi:MtN3 and saliva related transmembrane protein
MDALFTMLGFAAGFLTTLSFVPQALHSWKTRSAADLSWMWIVCFSAGVSLWFVYGVFLHSWPIILANAVTFLLVVPIVIVKLRQSRATAKVMGH